MNLNVPWRAAPFTALDFEATGMDPARDELVQVAAVAVAWIERIDADIADVVR